ncbi:hypothetical protein BGZ75_007332 [Mortierella antarctica]|nr:hypothetical protein BGZ75_007332 [Mortierella antarctica]
MNAMWLTCRGQTGPGGPPKVPICRDGQTEGYMVYDYGRRSKRDLSSSHGIVTAVNVSQISHNSYKLEYFVVSDINGTIIDDGSD